MKRTLAILLVLAFAAVPLAGCGPKETGQPPAQPTGAGQPWPTQTGGTAAMPTAVVPPVTEVGTVAARVNGQDISLAVFQKQFFQFKVALSDQKIDLNTEEGRAALAQVRLQVLNSLIELALIEQAASRMGIAITDDQLNTRVRETIAAGGGDEKFQAWLVESGISLEEFRDQLRAEMLTESVIHQITNAVSDKTEQVHARHILLGSEDKAQEALRRVQAGEDFATVAREMSVDDITRTEGGDLGFFPKGMLSVPREVEDAAFALQPGQVSGVVRSPYGFHIIQVVERQSDRVLQPDVYQAMKQKSFDEWLQRERATAQVEILIPME